VTRPKRQLDTVGWRERVSLPELSDQVIKAKVDTGARTSSLHAFDLRIIDGETGPMADFEIHPHQRSARDAVRVRCAIVDFRDVRPSSGRAERRPVIRTPVLIGAHHFDIDVTLTSRDAMGFRMLLGRVALRRRFLVDPGRSYIQGDPA